VSFLKRPRAHFKGVYTANVPTANNDKVSMTLDEPNVEPFPRPFTDAQYRLWMMQTKTVANPNGGSTVWLNSYFNYFGDSGMSFKATNAPNGSASTRMTSSMLVDGTILTPNQDLFLQGNVYLLGDMFFDKPGSAKMVDLDPIGIYGTQVFSGRLQVVINTPGGPIVMLTADNPSRAYLYDLNFDRNINPAEIGPQMGAGVWQMSLPLDGLTFNLAGNQSPTLSALQQGAQAGQGLVVRYVTYYTIDGITEEALAQKFQQTGFNQAIANAAEGLIVGTIGVWSNDDPVFSGRSGRLFYGTYPLPRPSGNIVFSAGRDRTPLVPKAAGAAGPPPYFLGPITAWVDTLNRNVVLDFSTTIPEDTGVSTPPAPGDLEKTNYGTLTLNIISGGRELPVNQIPYAQYNRAAYELSGGILEVPYPASLASQLADPNGILKLYGTAGASTQPLSNEINWAAVATDDRCLYLQVGETISYRVRPLWKGVPMPGRPIALTISQYQFQAQEAIQPPPQLVIKTMVPLAQGNYVVSQPPSQTYVTDANGYITFTVTGLAPGAAMIRYQAPGDNFNPNQDGATEYHYFGYVSYNAFRVLPDDNYDNIPDSQVTWDFVYQNVIRYFYLIYPGMFARLAFQNENIAKQSASIIAELIDKNTWDSTSYMPVSRDLSDGKRKLLQRWCALNQ
jgi:hypothetical protein